MGFNAVLTSLKEIFPQVDFRVLKAVAIENKNDLDAAVNDVLTEVLPFLNTRPQSPAKVQTPSIADEREEQSKELIRQQDNKEAEVGHLLETGSTSGESADDSEGTELTSAHEVSAFADDKNWLQNVVASLDVDRSIEHRELESDEVSVLVDETNLLQNVVASLDVDRSIEHRELESDEVSVLVDETNLLQNVVASLDVDRSIEHRELESDDVSALVDETNLMQNDVVSSDVDQSIILHEVECVNSGINELNCIDDVEPVLQKSLYGVTTSELPETDGVLESSIVASNEWKFDFPDDLAGSLLENERSIVQLDPPFQEYVPEVVPTELGDSLIEAADMKESTTSSMCNIEILEESIEDARHNKKTLFSAMESVISMMREVELEEKAVDRATEEAARGGQDIMVKVEELKQMLTHAKDANDMHAGEVYGEKAILATEVRELQCRLLSLSDERDKSLAILDEMHATLEERLAAVVELRKMAEDEKLEKEESARKALAEQEAIMEKVVQESKTLQQAADENSKLREFLMDRGHIVDMLQGEISVICQDVRLLKEKFDEHVPLSQSVSSSQTSCILASSGSSLKSMASDLLVERLESIESPKTIERASPVASVDGLSPKYRLEDKAIKVDKQVLMDDGWDVFDEDLLE